MSCQWHGCFPCPSALKIKGGRVFLGFSLLVDLIPKQSIHDFVLQKKNSRINDSQENKTNCFPREETVSVFALTSCKEKC